MGFAVCVLAGCSVHTVQHCGPPPVARPKRIVVPDEYVSIVGPKVARFWLTGDSSARPAVLDAADGRTIRIDSNTRRLGDCRHPCWTYVVLRPHTQVAAFVDQTMSVDVGSAQLVDSVWRVGDGTVDTSSGLRLKLAPGTTVALTNTRLRELGTWVHVTVDNHGTVINIEQAALGCA